MSEEDHLWQRWYDHQDISAREQLITQHLPYARVVAASYYMRRTHDEIEFDEYLQQASVGLVDAIERFNPYHGVQFKTFAAKRMQGSILNGLERLTEKNQQIAARKRLKRERLDLLTSEASQHAPMRTDSPDALFRYLGEVGIGLALGVLLDGTGMVDAEAFAFNEESAPVSPEVSYFRHAEVRQLQQLVRNLVGRLSKQEQMVIRYHYLQGIDFNEIATVMGVTRGRISQLHRQALLHLREHLAGHSLGDVLW